MVSVFGDDSNHDKLQSFLSVVNISNKNYEEENAYVHCVKAEALRIQNYFFEAIDEYLLSISFDENNFEAYKGLGLSYKRIGCTDESLQAFETARKLSSFDKEVYYELACLYFTKGNCCLAIKNLIRAIKIAPDFLDAQLQLGLVHEKIGENELAIAIYSKIIEQCPMYVNAYDNLGGLLIKLKRYHQAVQVFKVLLKVEPDSSKGHLGLAVAFDRINRYSQSIKHYKTYLERKPFTRNTNQVENRISALRGNVKKLSRKNHLTLIK